MPLSTSSSSASSSSDEDSWEGQVSKEKQYIVNSEIIVWVYIFFAAIQQCYNSTNPPLVLLLAVASPITALLGKRYNFMKWNGLQEDEHSEDPLQTIVVCIFGVFCHFSRIWFLEPNACYIGLMIVHTMTYTLILSGVRSRTVFYVISMILSFLFVHYRVLPSGTFEISHSWLLLNVYAPTAGLLFCLTHTFSRARLEVETWKQMHDKLQEANHAKSAFLSIIGHEVRTPLNAILGSADLLSDKSIKEQDQIYLVNVIKVSGMVLLENLNYILTYVRLESQKGTSSPPTIGANSPTTSSGNSSAKAGNNSSKGAEKGKSTIVDKQPTKGLASIADKASSLQDHINLRKRSLATYEQLQTREKQNFPLHELIEELISIASINAQRNMNEINYSCSVDPDTVIQCEKVCIREILLNLLSNACKFTKMGKVLLKVSRASKKLLQEKSITLTDDTNAVYLFEVQDNGIGIPVSFKSKIFNPFTQVDVGVSRRFEGVGLGLSISKSLCEQMGGKLWYLSEEGRGASFFCAVPVKVILPRAASSDKLADVPATTATLVDDEDEESNASTTKTSVTEETTTIGNGTVPLSVVNVTREGKLSKKEQLMIQEGTIISTTPPQSTGTPPSATSPFTPNVLPIANNFDFGSSSGGDGSSSVGTPRSLLTSSSTSTSSSAVAALSLLSSSQVGGAQGASAVNSDVDGLLAPTPIRKSTSLHNLKSPPSRQSASTNSPATSSGQSFSSIAFASLSPARAQPAAPPSIKVLVVDDNLVNLKIFSKMLSRLNVAHKCCSSGLEAVEEVEVNEYDLLLMDCNMPDLSGIEATKLIRKEHPTKPIIYLVSGSEVDDEDIKSANGFISKPLRIQTLQHLIDSTQLQLQQTVE